MNITEAGTLAGDMYRGNVIAWLCVIVMLSGIYTYLIINAPHYTQEEKDNLSYTEEFKRKR